MEEQGRKGRGVLAIISGGQGAKPLAQDPVLAREVEELSRRLEEKELEEKRLFGKIRQLEKESEAQNRKLDQMAHRLEAEIPFPDDSALAVETLRAKAQEFYGKGNLLDAFYLLRRIIRISPHDIGALYNIATIYYSAGKGEKAAEVLRLILEIDPDQDLARENLDELEKEI